MLLRRMSATQRGNDKLEDAARQINRVFSLCVGDRSPIEESRKWGAYYIANLQFKTYFKVSIMPHDPKAGCTNYA